MPMIQDEEIGLLNRKIVVEKVKSVFRKKPRVEEDVCPPPLPPKTFPKPRPALPPPLPPRKPPLNRLSPAPVLPVDPTVTELVENFTKLQGNGSSKISGYCISTIVEAVEEPISDDFTFYSSVPSLPKKVIQPRCIEPFPKEVTQNGKEDEVFLLYSPVPPLSKDTIQCQNIEPKVPDSHPKELTQNFDEPLRDNGFSFFPPVPPFPKELIQAQDIPDKQEIPVTFTTFKPKPDWKDAFFQPVKIKLEREGSASKLPKLVEGMLEQSGAKKIESYNAATLKRCNVRVSHIVSNFEQKGIGPDDEKQVFFRAGIIPQLETQRDEKLSGVIIGFQSHCRGFIARKKLAKLRVQDTAVRCIQRNVRKLMQVQEWPWWRLYVKICPLLNVRSHEEELIAKVREIETIRLKLEKLDTENAALRLDKDKLELKLNEMTADLTEERLNAAQGAERLDAETSERIRLEQELSQVSTQKSNLEQATERMELELHYAKSYDNTFSDGDDLLDGREDGDVYKRKCARLKRENEMLKQQLRQQHEDDLEQLVGLKKQLEKRLADANEEIDEQRQVAAEWKRKSQKLQAELNDFRIIVEEQNSRNSMLEKKQRKFDSELQMLQDEVRSEKNAKDRFARERDVAVSSKCTIEQTLASIRIELELKEEEVRRLTRELDEMSFGGATEQDIALLKKSKHDLEKKIKEQDDELDDLAGQVSLLESAKLKLEMTLESIRKEHRREIAQKDEEIEEVRSNAMKKLKSLEATLEQEYEERSQLLRSRHELERRLKEIEDQGRSCRAADEDALVRLRKDLRKTKALLRDAQAMLDRAKEDSHNKVALRALKNQLEDAEMAKESAVKAKQKISLELSDITAQLEDAQRLKMEAECKAQVASRNVNTLATQLEENEEELAELMKKYNQHLATEELRASEAATALSDMEAERNSLREQLAEATVRLESMAVPDPAPDANQRRLEIAIQDLKTRLDLDGAVRKRLEVQISRLKEKIERLTEEGNQHQVKELSSSEQVRKLQVALRESKEQISLHVSREQDLNSKKRDLEKRLEAAELSASAARAEVKLSVQRVQDLQAALTAEISESEETSDAESG